MNLIKDILIVSTCLSISGCNKNNSPTNRNPNVIIIYTDDLGYGDLSCYGAIKLKTPNIDKLASQGVMFTDAHSASAVCTPSRYALLTGQYPFRRNLFHPVFHKVGLVIDTAQSTIADIMKKADYSTACIGKWHLGFGEDTPDWNGILKPGPLELGFDYYYGIPVVNSHPPFVYVENYRVVGLDPDDPFVFNGERAETKEFPAKRGMNAIGGAKAAHALYDDEMVGTQLTRKAIEWINDNKNGPFFLYFSTTNIHHPFTPHPRFKGTSECGEYGDFVHELDWMVGEIMQTLDKLMISDNTLVVFTSDNGGMLNLSGQKAWESGHRLNGQLFGFKFDAWEGGHRIPFIARWPGKIKAGSVSDQLICNVDMLATLAELTGYKLKESEGPDSYNILPALMGNNKDPIRDHIVLAAKDKSHLTLRLKEWVYIGAQGGGGFGGKSFGDNHLGNVAGVWLTGQKNSDIENGEIKPDAPEEQLYNLSTDLTQSSNVIRENPEIAETMKKYLEEIKNKNHSRP